MILSELKFYTSKFHTWFSLFLLLFASSSLKAQDTLIQEISDIEQKIEFISENQTNELDYASLLEELAYFKNNPINLNHTNKEELAQLQLLNSIQINNLLKHLQKNGSLITVYELQTIDGFEMETIQQILPYIKVSDNFDSPHFTPDKMFKNGQHQIIFRIQQVLEEQKGFTPPDSGASLNSRYLGSSQKIYTRYRFNYGTNVSWGITGEKDAGEEFFKGTQKRGFDFYSGHFYTRNIRSVKAFALGDYQLTFGQGLAAWTGFSFGKSSDVINVKKIASGIQPYTSVDENLFMRGMGTTIGFRKFEFTGFFSSKKIDANVIANNYLTQSPLAVGYLQETGYHSTFAEIADRHSVDQTSYGGNLSYKRKNFKLGITAINTVLGAELKSYPSLYNQFEFSGKSIANFSADYDFLVKNFNFFGEAAMSDNGGIAYLNGLLVALDQKISISVLQRNYQRNYQSLFSNSFSENTKAANEKGIYTGFVTKPINSITISAYYDRFVFPWLKYQVNSPSYGNDYLAQINYTPSKKTDMYFRIRQRDKFKNDTGDENDIDFIVPTKQNNYRYNISYKVSPSVKLKNRIEYLTFESSDNTKEQGYLFYQDVIYKSLKSPLSFSFRYALFQTDSYNSRIYAFENDVLYAYSIPSYYYRGSRVYLTLDYSVNRKTEIWLRYAQSFYNNKNSISSGLTEIEGNTKSEVKLQIRYKF